jgi:hypothetical protein
LQLHKISSTSIKIVLLYLTEKSTTVSVTTDAIKVRNGIKALTTVIALLILIFIKTINKDFQKQHPQNVTTRKSLK